MKNMRFDVRKLTGVIGAEVFGADLSTPFEADDVQALRGLLLEHLVLFFRDQKLTPADQIRFAGYFGPISVHPAIPSVVAGHREILVISADENTKMVGEDWHTDISCNLEPPLGSLLYMLELPANGGGDTGFANMYAAYDELSDAMKRFLEGLTAVHDGGPTFRSLDVVDQATKNAQMPATEHPVIRTHPETGRKALYVNSVFTKKIVQLSQEESANLLAYLYRHIDKPHFHCRFKWQPNSLAFWDNRSTQHRPVWDYQGYRRYGHRVTIAGDRPFYR